MGRTAVVVGSGPNGLAAAIVLAQAGLDVTVVEAADEPGGGTRSSDALTVPGLVHDVCSAAHPFGLASPFFASLDLARHGLRWRWADVEAAQPLDDGRAGVLMRDLGETAELLGADGPAWRRVFGPLVEHSDELVEDILRPLLHVPRHPVALARFGALGAVPAAALAKVWKHDEARALFSGLAAHATQPMTGGATGGLGLMFGLLGHAGGWPVARRGPLGELPEAAPGGPGNGTWGED